MYRTCIHLNPNPTSLTPTTHRGCVDVVATVYGFVKKQMGTGRTLERGECSLPPLQYATRAFWLDVGVTAKRTVEEEGGDFEVLFYVNQCRVLHTYV